MGYVNLGWNVPTSRSPDLEGDTRLTLSASFELANPRDRQFPKTAKIAATVRDLHSARSGKAAMIDICDKGCCQWLCVGLFELKVVRD